MHMSAHINGSVGELLQANDKIVRALYRTLVTPVPTRWNSKFDSIQLFLKLNASHRSAMAQLFEQLGVLPLTKTEVRGLTDYVQVR